VDLKILCVLLEVHSILVIQKSTFLIVNVKVNDLKLRMNLKFINLLLHLFLKGIHRFLNSSQIHIKLLYDNIHLNFEQLQNPENFHLNCSNINYLS